MQEIHNAQHATFKCLDGIGLIMDRGSRTSKIVNLIHFQEDGMTNIMQNKIKVFLKCIIITIESEYLAH